LTGIGIFTSLLQITAIAAAASVSPSPIGFLVAIVITNLLITAILFWYSNRAVNDLGDGLSFVRDTGDLRVALRFAAPVSYLVLLDMVVWQRSEIFFLKRSSTLKEVAFYSLAFLIAGKLAEVVGGITSTLLQLQSQSYAREGITAVAEIQGKALRSVQTILAPLCLFGAVLAKPVVALIYGDAFSALTQVLWVLLLSPIAMSATDIGIASIYALGKQKSLLFPLTGVAVLNIILAASFVPRMGAVGAALANTTAQLLEGIIVLLFSTSMLSTKIPWRNLSIIYSAALLASAPALYLASKSAPLTMVMSATVMGCIGYVIALIYFGEISIHVLQSMTDVITRRPLVRPD
jgi:O-antigen/teichoic acid export membrane protein